MDDMNFGNPGRFLGKGQDGRGASLAVMSTAYAKAKALVESSLPAKRMDLLEMKVETKTNSYLTLCRWKSQTKSAISL